MGVISSAFYREAVRFIEIGASFGWHERNAGNISLLLNDCETAEIRGELDTSRDWTALPERRPDMAGEYVFTTVTGSYFTDVSADSFCICELASDGGAYRVVWGGERPTSEIGGHILSLAEMKRRTDGFRAVYHCHPADLAALTYLMPCDDKAITEALWRSETECAFVFPNGVGAVGFEVPGSFELARRTAEKLHVRDAAVWFYHGLFAAGRDIKDAFGRAHAIAKAAEIRLKIISSGREETGTITDEQLRLTAKAYGCTLAEF